MEIMQNINAITIYYTNVLSQDAGDCKRTVFLSWFEYYTSAEC